MNCGAGDEAEAEPVAARPDAQKKGEQMKKILIITGIVFSIFSCKTEVDDTEFKLDKNYRNWKKPVSEVLTNTVPGHGDRARVIYANDKAYQVTKEKMQDGRLRYDYPDGTVIIKEIYASVDDVNKASPQLTIMVKRRTSEKAANGWLYYVQPPNGEVMLVGNKLCTGCHDAANEPHPYFDKNASENFRDYIFTLF
jgi:hypothetical protein